MTTVLCRAEMGYVRPGTSGLDGNAVEVAIHDGRAADLPGWRDCGFELLDHPSSIDDWVDDDRIASVHYAEVEEVARSLTGCDAALVSDHVKRHAVADKRPREQAPVRLVHSDFAANYQEVVRGAYYGVKGRGAATLARSGLTAEQIERADRIVMVQFWRNLGPAEMDLPVAFCDSRTVRPDEARPFPYTGYIAGGRTFDAIAIVAPPDPGRHRWYTFPAPTADEVVAFRTYDTELVAANETWFTPHSAYRDPDPSRSPRFSIELRVMCLWL